MFPLRENGRIPQNFWQGPEKSLPLMPIFFAYCIVAIPLQCGNSILTENLKFLRFLLVPSVLTRCHCRDAKSVGACPVFLFYNHYPSQMVVAICWMLGVMEQYRAALHSSHYWNDIEVTSTDHPPPHEGVRMCVWEVNVCTYIQFVSLHSSWDSVLRLVEPAASTVL